MSYSYYSLILFITLIIPLSVFPKLIDENEKAEDTIYIKSSINEIFASTEVLQYFKNILNNTIELSVSFPLKKEISLSKFEITIGDKKVISKIIKKELAKEKYEDSILQGNTAFISEYEEDTDDYTIKIGNVKPGEFVQLQAFFYQKITSQDMSYEFNIMEKYPTFHYNNINQYNYRNKKIKAIFKINTQSKITRLIAPFYDDKAKKKSELEILFNDDYTNAKIYYIKNPDNQNNIDTIGNDLSGQVNKPTFYSTFCILFRTANINKPTLFYQYNPELKETSYAINYMYSSNKIKNIPISSEPDLDNTIRYSVKYDQNNNYKSPGLFIILFDQSGSMWGAPIELVKKALLSFIEILPKGSYFHLIGFGSHYKLYSEEPVEYNKDNIEKFKNIINDIEANLGGTNIGDPLKYIFENKLYDNIKLSKNIFILTDGQVNNRDRCIDLITKNNNKFRTHAIGIGNDFDKILIERSGKVGKGSSFFVNNIENIEMVMLNILIKCLRPYLIDIKYNFINYKNNIKNKIILTSVTNDFSYQDEIINYSFILNENNKILFDENINIEITAKDPINIIKEIINFKLNDNIIKLSDGNEMSKMIVGNALKNNLEFIENEKKEIEFATKYQILSKNTAIFTEIINKDGKIEKQSKKTQMTKVDLNEYKQEDSHFTNFQSFTYSFGGNDIKLGSPFVSYQSMSMGLKDSMNTKDQLFDVFNTPNSESIPKTDVENEFPSTKKIEDDKKVINDVELKEKEILKNIGNYLWVGLILYFILLLLRLLIEFNEKKIKLNVKII